MRGWGGDGCVCVWGGGGGEMEGCELWSETNFVKISC